MSNNSASRTLRPDMPFVVAAHDTLAAQLATLFVWSVFLAAPDRILEHHQMRIAAKQLRYGLDAFAEVLPASIASALDDLKALQVALGNLHDLDTLFLSIERAMIQDTSHKKRKRNEAIRARKARQRISLETLLSATAAERDAQQQRCLAMWRDLVGRDAFAPLQRTLLDLAALATVPAAPTPPTAEANC